MEKFEILIHDTFGEDLSYIEELPKYPYYPTLHDCMNSIGPVLANHYERHVHTVVLNVVDLKAYRIVEFMVDGVRPHVAVIRQIKNHLLYKS